ncbi:MAG: MarR family transcriptional regulator [Clostridia bacterium]|nr:MarR family transcriptional regulator [Clostridia bacterium]
MDILEKQKYIFGSLFLIANKLQVIGDHYLGKDDISTKQWFLTIMISQFGENPPTLSEVSALMGSSRQNVKQLALKLEEKGFLKIEKDEQDARALRLVMTEKSRVFWEERKHQDYMFVSNLFKDLNEDEINVMCNSFKKLFDKIQHLEKSLT